MDKDKKEVKNFLRKHKCLNKFKRNLAKQGRSSWLNNPVYTISPILAGFNWQSSHEGIAFWRSIETLWLSR